MENKNKKLNRIDNVQRNVQKIGDSFYVRVGADEMRWLGNPEMLLVTFENLFEEYTEIECPVCKTKVVLNNIGEVSDTEPDAARELNDGGNK